MKNILLCGFSPASIAETVINTIKEKGINIRGWLGRVEIGEMVKAELPNTAFFSSPFPIDTFNKNGFEELNDLYVNYLHDFLFLIERDLQYPPNYTFFQTGQLILDQLIYANYILETVNPDIVLFSEIPHSCITYSLYRILKKRGLPVKVLTNSYMPHIYEILDSFEDCNQLGQYTGNEMHEKLTEESRSFIDRLSSDYKKAKPKYIKDQEAKYSSIFKRVSTIKNKLLEQNKKPSIKSYSAYRKRNGLKRFYETAVVKEVSDYDFSYLFFALHLQPERTTMPQGDIFAQQLLAIKMIASLLPEKWKLIVKEHPSTFLVGPYPVRREEFYKSVMHLPNVTFVSTNTDTFKLIDNAKGIVTITGNIGLESLVRQKPVLALGYANFIGLKGAFWVRSYEDCKNAITAISKEQVVPDLVDIKNKTLFLESSPYTIVTNFDSNTNRRHFLFSGKVQALYLERLMDLKII